MYFKKNILLFSLFLISNFFIFADPCEGYWISYHITKKYPQGGWYLYVGEDGKLYGDLVALSETPADEATAIGFKGKNIKDYPITPDCPWEDFPTIGNPWMINMENKGEGAWEGGKLIDTGTGSTYKCRCYFRKADGKKFLTDTLEVKGEIVKGVGGTMYWKRATKEEALAVQDTHLLKKKK